MISCVFCKKFKDEDYAFDSNGVTAFEPLNPVTKGHLLVVPHKHVEDVSEDPKTSANVMEMAARLAKGYKDVNLITSKGKHATQTVKHLHVHIVPRSKGDDLKLPWTDQPPLKVRNL